MKEKKTAKTPYRAFEMRVRACGRVCIFPPDKNFLRVVKKLEKLRRVHLSIDRKLNADRRVYFGQVIFRFSRFVYKENWKKEIQRRQSTRCIGKPAESFFRDVHVTITHRLVVFVSLGINNHDYCTLRGRVGYRLRWNMFSS